ncbi:ABC transporter substrate-binding protein [Oryzomonas sagensis]|nr:ABC transporter substrate-binding protein [Oryzomonas sagensis]
MNRKRQMLAPWIVLLFTTILLCAACRKQNPHQGSLQPGPAQSPPSVRIGYGDSPLLGPLYAADERQAGRPRAWQAVPIGSGGDIGYSLISGAVDAGFVETNKAVKLLKAPGGETLKVAGAVQFPYGATLVIRKDLNIRLGDLAGRTIAAQEPDCKLLHQFRRDAKRLGVDVDRIRTRFMSFDEMVPALEAGKVDAVLVKGSYAVLAEHLGHKVLYQNWDIKAGDECCPAALAQSDYFLVVRGGAVEALKPVVQSLLAASALPPAELRKAVSKRLGYSREDLERLPTANFVTVGDDLRKELGDGRCLVLR